MACPWINGSPSKIYVSKLSFNFTDDPGIFFGHWALSGDKTIPDTVVAVGEVRQ